jgi:hypothetical protein
MKIADLTLHLHDYTMFPYERELALREVESLVGGECQAGERMFSVAPGWSDEHLWRLTYFARYENGHGAQETLQHVMERAHHASRGRVQRRQSTRYSVHGLHDYKGKFNPQTAHALLNIFGAEPRHRVLDPRGENRQHQARCAALRHRCGAGGFPEMPANAFPQSGSAGDFYRAAGLSFKVVHS